MKKAYTLILGLAVIASVLVTACKKYPEGPALSLRSKKARLAGDWKLDKVLKNGTDMTSSYLPSGTTETVNITKDGKWTESYSSGSFTFSATGTWEFVEKKEQLKMVTDGSNDRDGDTTNIVKLKNKELWTESKDGSDTYQYQYIPK